MTSKENLLPAMCPVYQVSAKEVRWTGIALEALRTLVNAEASRHLANNTTELAFPQVSRICPFLWPQLLPFTSAVFSVLTWGCYSGMRRLSDLSKVTYIETDQSAQPFLWFSLLMFSATSPSSSFCFHPHTDVGAWQEDTVKHCLKNVCRGTV